MSNAQVAPPTTHHNPDTPTNIKPRSFAKQPAKFPSIHRNQGGEEGVMQIGEFNRNISAELAAVVANGTPTVITRDKDRKPYVAVVAHDLFEDLLAAAGDKGKRVLARYQAQARQQNQTTQGELPLSAA